MKERKYFVSMEISSYFEAKSDKVTTKLNGLKIQNERNEIYIPYEDAKTVMACIVKLFIEHFGGVDVAKDIVDQLKAMED